MKRVLLVIALLVACLPAQAPEFQQPIVVGQTMASVFDWNVRAYASVPSAGQGTITMPVSYLPLPGGPSNFEPWQVGVPITVNDGNATETVTITASSCTLSASTCTVTATFANSHQGNIFITSGTRGLQEAIDYTESQRGGTVLLTSSWRGTSDDITMAAGYTDVLLRDVRAGNEVWYGWNGAAYSNIFSADATGSHSRSFEKIRYADQYGASPSNSAAANTTALQAWLNSGGTRLYLPDGVYTTNRLTLPSNVEIFGPGTLRQAAAATEVFYCAGCSNVWVHGITLQGVGGSGLSPAPTNDDCGIKIANPATSATVADIRIEHVTFTGWLLYGAWIQNAKDVWFDHNYFYSSGPLVRLEGVTEAHVTDNIARDTSIDSSVFKSAISLPGTTGGYATDQHVIIARNTVANYSNTQAVLIHSCTDCTVTENHLIGVNQGVGAAPATTGDTIVRLQVARNTYESTSTVGGSTGNQCIFVAGNSTASADDPVISGNSCYNANLVDQNTGEGAIGLSYTDGAVVEENSLNHSYVSGIYLNNVNTNLHIGSNLIANGQVVGGLNESVYLPSGQGAGTTGAITHNTFTSYLDGLRFDTSATGVVIGENTFTGVTGSRIVSPSNVTVATTSYGTVNARLQSDAYPSAVLDGPNHELCIGAGSVPCDVTLSRGAGGTASFNERVDALSLNINGTGPLFTTAQTGTGSLVLSMSPSIASPTLTGTTNAATISATALQQGGTAVALVGTCAANTFLTGTANSAAQNCAAAVTASAAPTHQFATAISAAGVLSYARPTAADLGDGTTGTGSVVLSASPALVTPNLGVATATSYATSANCSSSASPASCSSYVAGSVAVPAGSTTLVVDSTAVTSNSQIVLQFDASLGTKLGVTCNTNFVSGWVSARAAGTSFTITVSTAPTTNPACFSYLIVN